MVHVPSVSLLLWSITRQTHKQQHIWSLFALQNQKPKLRFLWHNLYVSSNSESKSKCENNLTYYLNNFARLLSPWVKMFYCPPLVFKISTVFYCFISFPATLWASKLMPKEKFGFAMAKTILEGNRKWLSKFWRNPISLRTIGRLGVTLSSI